MNRKDFLKIIAVLPIASNTMKLSALSKFSDSLNSTPKMPILFLGHGSPMNAIEENEFVAGFRDISKEITKPNAIICISAHWETNGTKITAMQKPRTIYDFGGFPKELYQVKYDVMGSPELANDVKDLVQKTQIELDHSWGVDHGAWSVVKHLYPNADIPVLQLSMDYNMSPKDHYELAKELNKLRHKGILIIGSGNIVHNLRKVDWKRINENFGYDWAIETNNKIKEFISDDNHLDLINYDKQGQSFKLAIPTPEHYLPLLYILALKEKNDMTKIFNDKAVSGSLTMTSYKFY
jgi:4,5-DOPA dioxygenase extradiol